MNKFSFTIMHWLCVIELIWLLIYIYWLALRFQTNLINEQIIFIHFHVDDSFSVFE